MDMSTRAQIDYATSLCQKLGYDACEYDFEAMSKQTISLIIKELKNEWEG